MSLEIEIKCVDITEISVDLIVLKHAQGFFGADKLVAKKLTEKDKPIKDMAPSEGEHLIFQTFGKIKAKSVVFIGVTKLVKFRYGKIREFSKKAMKIIRLELPEISSVAMTIHGVRVGLDEEESFLSQLGGILDAFREGMISPNLKKIIIVEINERRAERLEELLNESIPKDIFPKDNIIVPDSNIDQKIQRIDEAGDQSEAKPLIFVAMPFDKKFVDLYEFGIKTPVKTAGFICEKINETYFSGSILKRIKSRIEMSTAVIALLTGENPNVYLEVGYAWGKGHITILLIDDPGSLAFDVKDQRCIVYDSIKDLKEKLEREIQKSLIYSRYKKIHAKSKRFKK